MFTGIITDIGTVRTVEGTSKGRYTLDTGYDTGSFPLGASISCNGVCLTVVETGVGWFGVDVSLETKSVTSLGRWRPGDRINLERPLVIGDELGGHIVLGHVDGVAKLLRVDDIGDNRRLVIALEPAAQDLAVFLAPKGSVAVDGVSLTVNAVSDAGADPQTFEVNIIPHTLANTHFGEMVPGTIMNIEVDMMARYAARLTAFE